MSPREALLAGARQCLQERGYAHTTARDIAAASGAGLASIGYHFGSKEALLDQALRAAMSEWTDQIVAAALAAGADAPPGRRLRASMEELTASFATRRPVMVAFVEALVRAEREPGLRRELAAAYAELRARIAATISELLVDLPADQRSGLASMLLALCDGLLVQWLVDPAGSPSGGAVVDALAGAVGTGLLAEP